MWTCSVAGSRGLFYSVASSRDIILLPAHVDLCNQLPPGGLMHAAASSRGLMHSAARSRGLMGSVALSANGLTAKK